VPEHATGGHIGKARLVREIEIQIAMLESKARQPGIKGHDLQPMGA
jgi:predicted DNA-binding protein with PD1-like motif